MKHSLTWCLLAQELILMPLWADRLSVITWMGSPSGRGADRPRACPMGRNIGGFSTGYRDTRLIRY